jgi:hypothetical protein
VATLTNRELFDFVVDPSINAGNIDAALEALAERAVNRPEEADVEQEISDAVFHQVRDYSGGRWGGAQGAGQGLGGAGGTGGQRGLRGTGDVCVWPAGLACSNRTRTTQAPPGSHGGPYKRGWPSAAALPLRCVSAGGGAGVQPCPALPALRLPAGVHPQAA